MTEKIHIIGGGLVGPLMAIYLSQKGFQVELIECRPDMRKSTVAAGKSINLAVTSRGFQALKDVGLEEQIRAISIPMKGRMIHDIEGNQALQPYGQKEDEVIYAASRGLLNKMLLDAVGACNNVHMTFDRACTGYDIDARQLSFSDGTTEKAEVVIGADGAWSAIRRSFLEQTPNIDYAQKFLEYGYKELHIPPDAKGGFRMEKNALHIWPRKSYMMIALPNTDGSFTVTLFYPYEGEDSFERLPNEKSVLEFFQRDFPDALALMPTLAEDFFANPTGGLATIKCSPWHAKGRVLLIGDAAHGIVPFFAQGMNSGFEDCTLLASLIQSTTPDWDHVFQSFHLMRRPDTDAIADMAVENFVEMRDLVNDKNFLLKREVGFELEKRWPDKFIPRYSMVIFRPDIPYSEARRRGVVQDLVLSRLCSGVTSLEQIDWQKAERLLRQMEI